MECDAGAPAPPAPGPAEHRISMRELRAEEEVRHRRQRVWEFIGAAVISGACLVQAVSSLVFIVQAAAAAADGPPPDAKTITYMAFMFAAAFVPVTWLAVSRAQLQTPPPPPPPKAL